MEGSTKTIKKDRMIALEVSFAKVLAGNDKKLRDRAVKKLIKWLAVRSKGKTAFTEENFLRIWSGLFYSMWMSDKFLVQEELAESISKLIHCFNSNNESGLLFIKCFYKIMGLEWPGIDQHRIDKFCMLIRRFLRQTFEYCNRKDWDATLVKRLISIFEETVINIDVPNGFLLHFIDIFLEELSKVSKGKVENEIILTFLEPFVKITATTKDPRIHQAVALLFDHLIRQTDVGIEYEEKLRAWKELKMPCEKPEELELSFDDSQEEEEEGGKDSELDEIMEETALDPRAGKVDTILPQIPTDCDGIIKLIKKYEYNKSVTSAGRRELKNLERKFTTLKKGKMPESIRKPKILLDLKKKRRHTAKCAKELMDFTKKLDDADLELECNEIDSEEEPDEIIRSGSPENNDSKNENSPSSITKTKKVKLKSVDKIKKKINSSTSDGKENKRDKKEGKKKKLTSKINADKTKTKDKKDVKILKSKSSIGSFKVEDVTEGSDSLTVTPNKKVKSSNSWIVHNLDDEEENKIVTPKIIKLETKANAILPDETEEGVVNEDCHTPIQNDTPKLRLTAAFWEKARQKALKKKRNSAPALPKNPVFLDQSKNSRRISFALERNEAQENDEYLNEVRNSPSIPFDGARKPVQSALKSGLSPSPINPFYRFKKFH